MDKMKHLSVVDGAFLHLESPEMPMHVGSLHLFEPPPITGATGMRRSRTTSRGACTSLRSSRASSR
jgi:hypothetical protein